MSHPISSQTDSRDVHLNPARLSRLLPPGPSVFTRILWRWKKCTRGIEPDPSPSPRQADRDVLGAILIISVMVSSRCLLLVPEVSYLLAGFADLGCLIVTFRALLDLYDSAIRPRPSFYCRGIENLMISSEARMRPRSVSRWRLFER